MGDGGDAPIVDLSLISAALELEFWIETFVDVLLGAVIRRVQITNRSDRFRDVRLVFHHDLRLAPGETREAAYRDAESGGIVHHSGRRFVLLNMETVDGLGVPLWRVVSRASESAPGAEVLPAGGRIEGGSTARGRVDSIAAAPLPLAPGASGMATIWMAIGDTLREVRESDEAFRRTGIAGSLSRTRAHWNLWVSQGTRDLLDLPEDVAVLYHRSLVLLRLHQAPPGSIVSGIEAAPKAAARPEYRWCWHRDAAFAADALGRAGFRDATRRYLEFTRRSALEAGMLHSAVDPTGAPVGESPDPDALALPLWALARHFERERDVEFSAPIYRDLVVPTADRLAGCVDTVTHLPASSDVWGERAGFHASTAAAVRGGLKGAAFLAACFGEGTRARAWSATADQIGRAVGRELYRPDWGRFSRSIAREGRMLRPDPTVDASLLWTGLLDDLEAEDPRVRATVEAVRSALWVRTGVGGIARYERDPLGSVGTDLAELPGNPWIVTTLWLAQHSVRAARRVQDLDPARTLLLWCAARAEGWGALPEQLHPYGGETAATCPSLIAHAWLVGTVVDYVERLRILKRCERCGAPVPIRRELPPATYADFSPPSRVAHS